MGGKAIQPGEHLAEELEALEMSAAELARQIRVPTNRITEILHYRRATTGATLRLGHFFGTSLDFWLNLRKLYELRLAEDKAGKTIKELPTLAKRERKGDARCFGQHSPSGPRQGLSLASRAVASTRVRTASPY
jgi:antitoxin HigA-1